jgi:murein L,D-transpeptidase YcbB/YkuD
MMSLSGSGLAVPDQEAVTIDSLSSESEQIRTLIDSRSSISAFTCAGELICGISLLPDFYRRRHYEPAWITSEQVSSQAYELLTTIRSAKDYGLSPSDYHLSAIEQLVEEIDLKHQLGMPIDVKILGEADILMTDAFLLLGSHLYGGRVNPETIHSEWVAFQYELDLSRLLEEAIETQRVRQALGDLHPSHVGYVGMQKALATYRAIAESGGWPKVPDGESLKLGDENPVVEALRARLRVSGDLTDENHDNGYHFDISIDRAVRAFQRRHGIEADGVVGKKTREQLNIPVEERVRQIEINMERWRWIPHNLGERYLLVNIADFSLKVFENGRPASEMKVIVGRPFRKTPVFSSRMTYLVLNPYWNVPYKLAVEDLLPKIQQDQNFIKDNGFRIFSDWSDAAVELDPLAVDWHRFDRRNFPYRLRQDPGPQNALGRIKFMFPNKFAVYLHDTPSRRLFEATSRGYSSGCIRVERPVWLAEFVLKGQDEWSFGQIEGRLNSGEKQTVQLRRPIDVHLLYWTAWVSDDGVVHFRDDIYGRDLPLATALSERLTIG